MASTCLRVHSHLLLITRDLYCVNYSLNKGLCCTKWLHSHLLFGQLLLGIKSLTRMHSSRMHTAHSLTVCHGRSICLGDSPPPHTPPATHTPRHAHPPCMPPAMHAPLPCTPPSMHTPPPLWTEFLTHASENITLPQIRCGG